MTGYNRRPARRNGGDIINAYYSGDMMLKQAKIGLPLALGLLLLAGCTQIREYRRGTIFDARFDAFSSAIRWGEFEQAESFIKMRDGTPRKLDLDALKTIRVTRFMPIEKKSRMNEDEEVTEVSVLSEIEFYLERSGQVKKIRYRQLWWYDSEADSWFLDGDLPDFSVTAR